MPSSESSYFGVFRYGPVKLRSGPGRAAPIAETLWRQSFPGLLHQLCWDPWSCCGLRMSSVLHLGQLPDQNCRGGVHRWASTSFLTSSCVRMCHLLTTQRRNPSGQLFRGSVLERTVRLVCCLCLVATELLGPKTRVTEG